MTATRKRAPVRRKRLDPATAYATRVRDGKILAGRAVRLACERHLRDLERQRTRGFPYYFDELAARHIIDFFPKFLTLETGAPFVLPPWLQFCYGCIFGWKRVRDDERKYQYGFLETGKGSAKTPSGAGIGLYIMVFEDKNFAEIYSAAFDKGQASIILNDAIRMAEASEPLQEILEIGKYNIANLQSGSFFRAVSSEHRGKSGPRPYVVLGDEIHEHRDGRVINKLTAGFKGHTQPLALYYTNSGSDRTSICWEYHDKSLQVLEGTAVDEQWFAYVCHLDPCEKCYADGYRQPREGCEHCDDWTDPAVWPKVAPALGIVIQPKYLQDAVDAALSVPSERALKQRLNFCIWCVAPDTLITLWNGDRIRAGQLQRGHEILAFDETTQRLCIACVGIVKSNGETPAHRVVTARGREVTVTPNHRFWARSGRAGSPRYGWKEARDIKQGDRIAVALGHVKRRGGRRVSRDVAHFLGIMTGDGTTAGGLRLTATNEGVVRFCREFAVKNNCVLAPLPDGAHYDFRHGGSRRTSKQTAIRRLVKHHGLHGRTCFTKRVPPLLFSSGEPAWLGFLSGYLDTDGHVTRRSIQWTSANRPLLQDCQHLLALLGVQSSVRDVPTEGGMSYRLEVHHAAGLRVLAAGLQLSHTRKASAIGELHALTSKASDDSLVCGDEMQFDRVVLSEPVGPTETIGIEVNGVHTHVTNGLITHNTDAHTIWIPPEAWSACKVESAGDNLEGARAFAFDMSEKLDLTAGVAGIKTAAPPEEAGAVVEITDMEGDQEVKKSFALNFYVDLIPFFWLPEETLHERVKKERIPFDLWERSEDRFGKHLRVTPGPVIDYDLIYEQFRDDIGKRFKPQRIAYDPHNATQFALQLRDKAKYEVAEIAQGRKLSESFKLFEALVRLKRIRHNGNPVMAWCVANAEPKRDRYQNLWIEKPSQTKRIDGLIAAVMVLSQLMVLPMRSDRRRGLTRVWTPGGFTDPMKETHATT